jgi:hypothetical protein
MEALTSVSVARPQAPVVEVVDPDEEPAGDASVHPPSTVSLSSGSSASFACPSCQRRYPYRDWRPRFTCQDAACLMTWSPLAPLANG